jgi:hypothetical protein
MQGQDQHKISDATGTGRVEEQITEVASATPDQAIRKAYIGDTLPKGETATEPASAGHAANKPTGDTVTNDSGVFESGAAREAGTDDKKTIEIALAIDELGGNFVANLEVRSSRLEIRLIALCGADRGDFAVAPIEAEHPRRAVR